eukprot:jgi/Hompol1/6339/HPOL_001507-RA
MSRLNVLVYDGPGVSSFQQALLRSLRAELSQSYDVVPVDADALRSAPWPATAALLVMPGGRDRAFLDALGPAGAARIARFVRGPSPGQASASSSPFDSSLDSAQDSTHLSAGGAYLGLCAGAYFACDSIDFEPNRSDYHVHGDRPLKFCPAVARGSVSENFVYASETGAAALALSLDQSISQDPSISLYVNGGPYFDLAGTDPSATNVLARYADTQQPAIVHCTPGNGNVVLVGPHIELSADYIHSRVALISDTAERDHLAAVHAKLVPHEYKRRLLLRSILSKLGLVLNEMPADSLESRIASVTLASEATTSFYSEPELSPIYACFASVDRRDAFLKALATTPDTATTAEVDFTVEDLLDTVRIVTDPARLNLGPNSALSIANTAASYDDSTDSGKGLRSNLQLCAAVVQDLRGDDSSRLFSIEAYWTSLMKRRNDSRAEGAALFGLPLLYANVVTSTQSVLEK